MLKTAPCIHRGQRKCPRVPPQPRRTVTLELQTLTRPHRRATAACLSRLIPRPLQRLSKLDTRPLPRPAWPPGAGHPVRRGRIVAGGPSGTARTVKVPLYVLQGLSQPGKNIYISVCSSGQESDSVCSTVDFVQERAPPSCQKDPNQQLLDKLTQEKLDSKTNKPNDLSSGTSQSVLQLV